MGEDKEVTIDFSSVKPFDPLDQDRMYRYSVRDMVVGEGPQGPKIRTELTIDAPDEVQAEEWSYDEDGHPVAKTGMMEKDGKPVMTRAKGRLLFREFSLLPQALPYFHGFLKSLDPTVELGSKFKLKAEEWIGLQGAAKIENEPYEEQIRARVKATYPASRYSE